MCYSLSIASALTLSEVRSMLPSGITADVLSSGELAQVRDILPAAQTLAVLRVGACSCDLVRSRLPDPREDERHLRVRYKALGLPRERIIRELERHRRSSPLTAAPAVGWHAALAAFVAEHARNAGPALFRLSFVPASQVGTAAPRTRTVTEILAGPERWLEEGVPTLVLR